MTHKTIKIIMCFVLNLEHTIITALLFNLNSNP